jgi:tetratricopeptide (TPR) repeat protein
MSTIEGSDAVTGRGENTPFERADTLAFLLIVAGAFALRLVYILQYRSSPTFAHPIMDPLYHVEWARALAAGESFMAGEPYFRAPLYPWLLGICFRLFGESYLLPRIFQAALSALTCGFLFLTGRRAFGRLVGIAAGAVAAAYWLYLYFAGELLITTLIVFLDAVLMWLLLRADHSRAARRFFAAGLVLGLSAIARPNIVLFGLFVLPWIGLSDRGRGRRALSNLVVFAAACLIPILPVTVRNYVAGGDLVAISSQGGVNFYIGNSPDSDGIRAVVPGTRPDWWGGYYDSIEIAERAEGRDLRPSQVSDYFLGRGLAFIREDPGAWLELTGRKVRYYTNARVISNNQPIGFFARRYAPVVRYLPVGFGIVAPLGILGLILSLRRRRLFPLWGFVIIYSASVVAFFVCTRFRMPVTGILIVLASMAVSRLAAQVRRARWRQAALMVLALAVLYPAVNIEPRRLEDPNAEGYEIVAILRMEKGDAVGALKILREGVSRYPGNAALLVTMGEAYAELGDFDRAERVLRQAIDKKTDKARESFGRAGYLLGYIAARKGDDREAEVFFRQSIRHDPHFGRSYYYLGILLAEQGELEQASALFRKALQVSEAEEDTCFLADVHFDLGRALIQLGRPEEGMGEIRRALGLDPDHRRARAFLRRSPGE